MPDDAERSRTLLAAARTGMLATLGEGGYPFGSVVAPAVDEQGRPLLLLSDLAVHSHNLAADPRASLMVTEPGKGDPLDLARVTVIGPVTEVPEPERAAALATYQQVHPGGLGTDHGFRIYRLDVTAVRFVGGFARMSWVDAAAYTAAEPDPLAPHVDAIVGHMNDDHGAAMVLYCQVFADRPATAAARMTGIDRYGFDLLATDETGKHRVRLPFAEQVTTPTEARKALVAMVQEARAISGRSTDAAPTAAG
ncbi:HugZ family protein [Pseudonocardia sp. CA-107938]|uniref:HugZ family pyridoxamine 5'-phosphate oxidase n=1 Tax=Pseudonocardia sp. CA-107938 TaxID=3240021 RepID=UPI003D8DC579